MGKLRVGISASGVIGMVAVSGLTLGVTPAAAQVPFDTANFHGYATGTVVHVDALQAAASGPQLANAEVAFSGASVASKGAGNGGAPAQIVNEMSQIVQPKLPVSGDSKLQGTNSFGRGSGLEVGLGQNLPAGSPQIPVSKVQVSALPNSHDDSGLLEVPAAPLAYAKAARGLASAQWSATSACPLGDAPLSFGEGYVADARLLSQSAASTNPPSDPLVGVETPIDPTAAVSDAKSFEVLAAPTDAKGNPIASDGNGLLSETLETIAPVTLFQGTPNEVTIRVLGTWQLQVVAGGVPGSAYVQYGPVPGSFKSNILEVDTLDSKGAVQRQTFTFQDVFGNGGLTIPAGPLVTLKVGTPPHAIGGDGAVTAAKDGTSAAGAVDVVSAIVGDASAGVHIADLRIGHMEGSATVPAGGISCTIPITKVPNHNPVKAGDNFTYTITLDNTTDCTLDPAKVVDHLSGDKGVKFSITGEQPKADNVQNGDTVTWNNVGPIPAHGKKQLTLTVHIPSDSAAGTLTDKVDLVKASCANGGGTGITGVVTGVTTVSTVTGSQTVTEPKVVAGPTGVEGKNIPKVLPRTGSNPALPLAALAALAVGGGLLRWRRTRLGRD
ncbi:MAG TPA: LPXTG cell wall anchor domain-containing protein [Mycobacteriales bacterium]|nr:LPXTG cell wall anchor domain-containing protein [Mycobacteriales bacterium]